MYIWKFLFIIHFLMSSLLPLSCFASGMIEEAETGDNQSTSHISFSEGSNNEISLASDDGYQELEEVGKVTLSSSASDTIAIAENDDNQSTSHVSFSKGSNVGVSLAADEEYHELKEEGEMTTTSQGSLDIRASEDEQQTLEELNSYYFVGNLLVPPGFIPESKIKRIVRLSSPVISILLAGIASLPTYNYGYSAGRNNEVLAILLGSLNAATTGLIYCWGSFNLLKGIYEQSPEKKTFFEESHLNRAAHVAPYIIAIVTPVPLTYFSYRYNSQIWYPPLTYVMTYGLEVQGYSILFKNIISSKKDKEVKLINKSTEEFKQILNNYLSDVIIPSILAMNEKERDEFILSIHRKENPTFESYLESLLSLSPLDNTSSENPDTWKKGFPKKILTNLCVLIPFVDSIGIGYAAYKGWSSLYDHDAFSIPMSCVSTLPYLCLNIKGIVSVSSAFYDTVFYRFIGNSPSSLEKVLYPKISKALPSLRVGLAGCVGYVCQFLYSDLLEEILPYEYATAISMASATSVFCFILFSSHTLINDFLIIYTKLFGDEVSKRLVSTFENIGKVKEAISLAGRKTINKLMNFPWIKSIFSSEASPVPNYETFAEGATLGGDT